MTKAIALLSGGQDSTTCLYWARINFDEVLALSIFYGQRHKSELEAAVEIASLAGAQHVTLEVPVLGELSGSALVTDAELKADGGIPDKAMPQGLPTSFVPGRNALFFTMAAAVAVREGCSDIVAGVCQTDYSGYPDCRREFVDSFEKMIGLAMPSSSGPFRIHTPLMHLTKAESVHLAGRMPGCMDALKHSITCYEGKRPGCGECAACELRIAGFAEAGVADPAE